MTWQIRAGLYLALIAAIFLAGCYVTRDHYKAQIAEMEAQWAKENQAAAQAQVDMVAAQAKLQHDAEVQHGKDQIAINNLRGQLADSVRVHIPQDCSAGQAGSSGADSNGSAGVFPNRVDAAFARLQSGVDRLAARCDQLNIDARAMNAAVGK